MSEIQTHEWHTYFNRDLTDTLNRFKYLPNDQATRNNVLHAVNKLLRETFGWDTPYYVKIDSLVPDSVVFAVNGRINLIIDIKEPSGEIFQIGRILW